MTMRKQNWVVGFALLGATMLAFWGLWRAFAVWGGGSVGTVLIIAGAIALVGLALWSAEHEHP